MKTPPIFCSFSLALAFLAAPLSSFVQANEDEPTGALSSNTKLVHEGVRPELYWNIVYPDLPFDPPTGKTTEDVTIYVSVLGVALEGSRGEIPASARIKVGSKWYPIFSGKGATVQPGKVLLTLDVDKGTAIKLGAEGSSWGERTSDSQHVTVMKDGDIPPAYAPAFNQGDVSSFISGYMSGNKVSIGAKDVIYAAELYSESPGSEYYDMQDIVVHVRFEERTTYHPPQD